MEEINTQEGNNIKGTAQVGLKDLYYISNKKYNNFI